MNSMVYCLAKNAPTKRIGKRLNVFTGHSLSLTGMHIISHKLTAHSASAASVTLTAPCAGAP